MCQSVCSLNYRSTWHRVGRLFLHFSKTCRMLGIRRVNTSSYNLSNGMIDRWNLFLHTGLSHVDSTDTNLDILVHFMAYRATPNTTKGYSPFYLLRGREITLPSCDDLKAKLSEERENSDYSPTR